MADDPLHVLYVVYWGALEPLGQALVLPALERMCDAGVRVTLVTFEKPHDLADAPRVEAARRRLHSAGHAWIPLRYHQRPTLPATAWDICQGIAVSARVGRTPKPDVVVGRTFIGGAVAVVAAKLLRRPFVYYAEGFMHDEQAAGGRWAPGSRPYRTARSMEAALYRRADGVVNLSETAQAQVQTAFPGRPGRLSCVVPSCVDLQRFEAPEHSPARDGACNLVYLGSLGGRYRVDQVARFLLLAREEIPGVRLDVISHSSLEMVREGMRASGVPDEWWSCRSVPHVEVPGALRGKHAGLHLLAPGTYVGSPTKVGEYWASGIPVVTSPGVGDVDGIIQQEGVGVVAADDSDAALTDAARRLRALLADPELPRRCRTAAERHYSLDGGVNTQLDLYRALAGRRQGACASRAALLDSRQRENGAIGNE